MATGVNAVLNADDNLVNNVTYTFVFQCNNLFSNPSASTLANDIQQNAPNFLTSVQVVAETGTANKGWYNIVFTYEGDGSDVVSDVAQSLITAFLQGSSDNFTYMVGFGASIPNYNAAAGGGSQGVVPTFSAYNLLGFVSPTQQAAYASEASAQVQAVGTSPGGQVATAVAPTNLLGQNTFTNTVNNQAAQAAANVNQIVNTSNQQAAGNLTLIIGAIIAAIVGFLILAPKPSVSVSA